MVRILDVGRATGGMTAGSVFKPWTEAEVFYPRSFEELEQELPNSDIVIFGGGQDIHPKLYGHSNVSSHVGITLGRRDLLEELAFKQAVNLKKAIFGVCRGAQLACALSGGFLYQDVRGHTGGVHDITTDDGQVFPMTTIHHQQMNARGVKHKLIAWTNRKDGLKEYDRKAVRSKNHEMEISVPDGPPIKIDPEIIYFKETRSLAVQGHPEFMDVNCPTVEYIRKLVQQYLLEQE